MKNKFLKILSNLLLLLATGTTAVFIAACYGVPSGFRNIKVWCLNVTDVNKKPIMNISVRFIECNNNYSENYDTISTSLSDSLGSTFVELSNFSGELKYFKAELQDIDSVENGLMNDTTILYDNYYKSDIVMSQKK